MFYHSIYSNNIGPEGCTDLASALEDCTELKVLM